MVQLIPNKNFTTSINGKLTSLCTLKNANGLVAQITNYGATLVSLWTPDRNGAFADIVLGYDHLNHYIESENSYFGKTIGRYGNRIGNANFTINGKKYHIDKNEGMHHVHGGHAGFHTVVWKVVEAQISSITLEHLSLDESCGYPGNVRSTVTYTLKDDDSLQINYTGKTDAPTHVNLTHHSYFNLEGQGSGDILDHSLQVNADSYTPVDKKLIPTGAIDAVSPSLDFRKSKKISTHMADQKATKGYDHNFVVRGSSLRTSAILTAPTSGRQLEILSTEPGLQFYTGQGISSTLSGKEGTHYEDYAGLCLEPQHFPDSPNKPKFPSTLLVPGETYLSKTMYRFSSI